MPVALELLTSTNRWIVYVAVMAVAAVSALALRIWTIERSHRRIRNMLEKRVHQRTRELEQAFTLTEQVVNAVEAAIVVVDAEGRAVLVNPSARQLLGIGDGADDTKEVYRNFARDNSGLHATIRNHLTDGVHEPFTVGIDVGDRHRILEISVTSLDGPDRGHVYVIRDVTEALTLLEMKSRFVSVVSHEIRTPLTSLAGSLDLLDAGVLGTLPTRAADLISVACHSTDRLVRLVNDILDLDRLESQKVTLNPTWQRTDDLITEILRTMQPMVTEHRLSLLVDCRCDHVFADHDRVVQVLLNLVQNAIKFSPPDSTILISTRRDTDEVVFTVEDEGRGIPPTELDRVFEAFTQVDSADDRLNYGTGLGLTISRGIVQRHGGRIWAENRRPVGTRFVFTLPLTSQEALT